MKTKIDENKNISTDIVFDKNSKSLQLADRYYPSDYEYLRCDDNSAFSRDFGNDKWVYSFLFNNDLLVYDLDGKQKIVACKSKFAKSSLDIPDGKNVNQSLWPRYTSLIYDKWQNVFYRIFLHDTPITKETTREKICDLIDNPEVFSVIVLDENLNVIGETEMPKNMYNPEMFFVNKSGLNFAFHVLHPQFDPDYLKFGSFKVKSIEL
jgi:hypothetical protein